MILPDTNVISETMTVAPSPPVLSWLNAQADGSLFLSSISAAGLLFGVRNLPDDQRRARFTAALDETFQSFVNRILSFDTRAAVRYADLAERALAAGRGFPAPA